MWHAWGKREMYTGFLVGKHESDHLEDQVINGRILFKWMYLAEDVEEIPAVLFKVMNFWVNKMRVTI